MHAGIPFEMHAWVIRTIAAAIKKMIDEMSDVLLFMKKGDIIRKTKLMEVDYEKSSL